MTTNARQPTKPWSRETAAGLAELAGIGPLGDGHWKVLEFVRRDARLRGQSPGLRRIARLSGVSMREIYRLFAPAPGRLIHQIADLPRPEICL